MRRAVVQQLKHHTAATHARVEDALGLLDPDLSAAQLRSVLERFAGFWQGNERLIDEWAEREPELAESLCWPRRRRREVLRSDLLRLGLTVRELTALPEAPAVFVDVDTADALGWIYVSEGTTLGGAITDRSLQALTQAEALRVRTFTPYLEGPGPMWRSYLSILEDWVGNDPGRCARVVDAATGTFDALERWLVEIDTEDAA